MQELLRLQTPEFELTVWCSDSSERLKSHQSTIGKRSNPESGQSPACATAVRFHPPLQLEEIHVAQQSDVLPPGIASEISSGAPLFFENMQYQFEWIFWGDAGDLEKARLTHRSPVINEGFRFSAAHNLLPARFTGTVNTGNDVGWMRIPLEYTRAGQIHQSHIAFEVFPTKMDLRSDLPAMYQALDKDFPLWRFSLVEKTEQNVSRSQHRGYFPLLWLASFKSLRERLEKGLNLIAQAPHNRLQPEVLFLKADRIKGRLTHQLAAKVKEGINDGRHEQRYRLEKKRLSVDTPENRFIRMVVMTCGNRLAEFETKLRTSNQAPDRQRLSDAFLDELHSWQKPLRKMQHQSFLKDVGNYQGMTSESLVLQQKTGYSTVYRIWQELKYYLDVFANQSEVSMKSVAEIYEVWCFLEIRNILISQLGFKDVSNTSRKLQENNFYEYQLKDGFAGAFEFTRADGVRARLAHEPVFRKAGTDIRTYLVTQKPDIVLEVQIPGPVEKRFIWVFDAKYRIKTERDQYDDAEKTDDADLAPDDAINQMHRYRDALIRITRDKYGSPDDKSRPVVGAFALYPGYFNQHCTTNPYADGINETGIGAFAMLPDADGHAASQWLTTFLSEQIGSVSVSPVHYGTGLIEENLYTSESARIPYDGMKQVLYPDLTLTAALGDRSGRSPAYFEAFQSGAARWYHTPVRTFVDKYKQHIAKEIRFLGLATTSDNDEGTAVLQRIWPVKNVLVTPRHNISVEQSGKVSESGDLYFLFELGTPLQLQTAVYGVPRSPFKTSMKLTRLLLLENRNLFSELGVVYADAIDQT